MTKRFSVFYTCQHCGGRTSAETGFGRWMRHAQGLDSSTGIVRTDTDHWVLRYKTHASGRDIQLLMAVEVKEHGSEPDICQIDVLSFVRQMVEGVGKNMYGAETRISKRLWSKAGNRIVRVRWLGIHLLQFSHTSPADSQWIKWDRRIVDTETLTRILAMDRNPYRVTQSMDELLRDRHAKPMEFKFTNT